MVETITSRDDGLFRESLQNALSGERTPSFGTILKVVGALGIRLKRVSRRQRGTAWRRSMPSRSMDPEAHLRRLR
jgi:hypothetical protein